MADALAGAPQVPKRTNVLGRMALGVSVIGLMCMWGAMPLGTALGAGILGIVVCVTGWILMPIAFAIGCVGLLLSGRGKAACTAAVLISTIGSASSFVLLLMGMMLADAFHHLPN